MSSYPTEEAGLHALVEAPSQARGWSGPYIDRNLVTDPWGRPYIYRMPGATRSFDLLTLGRDGQPGGAGEDADLSN